MGFARTFLPFLRSAQAEGERETGAYITAICHRASGSKDRDLRTRQLTPDAGQHGPKRGGGERFRDVGNVYADRIPDPNATRPSIPN